MNALLIIFFGSILGQLLFVCGKSFYVQQSSKYQLNFWQAFKVYTVKYTGPLVVGAIMIFIAMFVYPNIKERAAFVKEGEVEYAKWFMNIVNNLRIYSVILGILAQGLGFLVLRKGEKYLRDEENKLGDNQNNQP